MGRRLGAPAAALALPGEKCLGCAYDRSAGRLLLALQPPSVVATTVEVVCLDEPGWTTGGGEVPHAAVAGGTASGHGQGEGAAAAGSGLQQEPQPRQWARRAVCQLQLQLPAQRRAGPMGPAAHPMAAAAGLLVVAEGDTATIQVGWELPRSSPSAKHRQGPSLQLVCVYEPHRWPPSMTAPRTQSQCCAVPSPRCARWPTAQVWDTSVHPRQLCTLTAGESGHTQSMRCCAADGPLAATYCGATLCIWQLDASRGAALLATWQPSAQLPQMRECVTRLGLHTVGPGALP